MSRPPAEAAPHTSVRTVHQARADTAPIVLPPGWVAVFDDGRREELHVLAAFDRVVVDAGREVDRQCIGWAPAVIASGYVVPLRGGAWTLERPEDRPAPLAVRSDSAPPPRRTPWGWLASLLGRLSLPPGDR